MFLRLTVPKPLTASTPTRPMKYESVPYILQSTQLDHVFLQRQSRDPGGITEPASATTQNFVYLRKKEEDLREVLWQSKWPFEPQCNFRL